MIDELTEACNCACLYLPIGWTIEISLEKDSGGVNLFDPFGDVVYFPRDDMTLAVPFLETVSDGHTFAIDLKTGAIHVQHAGKIVVVTLAEWSAES